VVLNHHTPYFTEYVLVKLREYLICRIPAGLKYLIWLARVVLCATDIALIKDNMNSYISLGAKYLYM
jgi:hypothetical protein